MQRILAILMGLLLATGLIHAGEGKLKGLFFGDYYYVVQNHNQSLKNKNGFWFRRIYVTYDYRWDTRFSMRLRLEMAHPGDFTTSGLAIPFVKDAYLKYQTASTQILLGISPSPTFAVIETVWGYRSVEKTPVDLQKFGSSRDFGVAIKGILNGSGTVRYHLMVGNGNGNKSENNPGKKVMLSFGYYPAEGILLEFYSDYEKRSNGETRNTGQLFLAYRKETFRLGIQAVNQLRVQGNEKNGYAMASVFAIKQFSSTMHLLGRVDRLFTSSPANESIAYLPFSGISPATLFIVGLDYSPAENIHLIPNTETIFYDKPETGDRPATDILPRLTLFVKF